MKIEKKQKKIASNTIYTMGGMLVMNGVLQLMIYPLLNREMGAEPLGELLFIMGLVSILCPSVGQALNNSRLVVQRQYEIKNGDYNCLLLVLGIIGSIAVIIICKDSFHNMGLVLGVFVLLIITIFRYYGDIEYRINLNYKRYFIYYILLAAGYLVGYGIYKITDQWIWVFLIGELAAVGYVFFTGTIFHKAFIRSEFFNIACKRGLFLTISYIVTNITLNIDRLVLKNMMGNVEVTEYYVVSLVGKTMVLLIAPINTIVISYLTKRKELLNRTQFLKASLAGGVVSLVFFLGCQIGTPLFVWLFYRDLFEAVRGLMAVANLSQILGMYSAFLFILVLTFSDEKWQLWLQAAHFVILTASTILCTKMFGMTGFAYAVLGANVIRVAAVIVLGSLTAKGKEANQCK